MLRDNQPLSYYFCKTLQAYITLPASSLSIFKASGNGTEQPLSRRKVINQLKRNPLFQS